MCTRKHWRSTLWRKAGRVTLRASLSFREFWEPLYRVLLVIRNMTVGPKPRSMELVHSLFAAVNHMREFDFLTATIVISPTSPKPQKDANKQDDESHAADGSPVPVCIAKKGLGAAGKVDIPVDIWRSLVHPNSLQAMTHVQIRQPSLASAVKAMTWALIQQRHIHFGGNAWSRDGPECPCFCDPKFLRKMFADCQL